MDVADFYTPTDKQLTMHNADERYIGIGGGVGGGKSEGLVMDSFICAITNPGNNQILGRYILKQLKETTLETWKKVIPAELYRLAEHDNKIYIPCGKHTSVIHLMGFTKREETAALSSFEAGAVHIDQCEEFPDNLIRGEHGLLTRFRWVLPNKKRPHYRFVGSANPRQCAFKEIFISNPIKGSTFIKMLYRDNPHLPPEYIPNLRELYKYSPELLEALLEGNWDVIADGNVIIKNDWINTANSNLYTADGLRRGVTCDPSRFGGDETVIYGLDGTKIVRTDIFTGQDTYAVAAKCVAMCKELDGNWMVIDEIGIGAGVVDAARQIIGNDEIRIMGFNGASKSNFPERFYNLRAESWWHARESFGAGRPVLPNDPVLDKQLNAVHYSYSGGRILVEDKEDIIKTIGRSPDRADALVMGLWYLPFAPTMKESQQQQFRKKIETNWERARRLTSQPKKSYYDQDPL